MQLPSEEKLLVSGATGDDAGVLQINEEQALVFTTDFITPPVDDAYLYGRVAAANSLSDIYAMGGRPLMALNISCFPTSVPAESLREILRGGQDVAREGGCLIVGGHTVKDDELKYPSRQLMRFELVRDLRRA